MTDTAASRREIFFESTLAPGETETYDLYAELTAPEGASTLLITLHGVGFSHEYWDFPLDTETFSFVEAAAEAGIARQISSAEADEWTRRAAQFIELVADRLVVAA